MARSATPPAQALGHSAVDGAVYIGGTQAARLCLTVLSTLVIARLLGPGDYGVIAMVAPVIGFAALLQELGLGAATIQKETITTEQSNALFWINLITSAAIALLLIAAAPLVALFYAEPKAGYVTAASAATIMVGGMAMQHNALLHRDMRFRTLSMIELANATVAFLVAAAAAWWLRSYWALFLGVFAAATVQALLTWRACAWRPAWRAGLSHAGGFLRFGGHVTGFNVVTLLVRHVDAVLIARFAGAGALGLYDRSYRLMMLPIQGLNTPAAGLLLPVLSRLKDDPVRYRAAFLLVAWAVMLALVPPVLVGAAHSSALMNLLLGEAWVAAGPIFFWLGLSALVQPIPLLTNVLFMSRGETSAMLRWGMLSALVTLAGFAVGLRWGAQGVAASLFFTALLRIPIVFAWSTRRNPVRPADLYQPQLLPVFGAALGVALSWPLAAALPALSFFLMATGIAYAASLSAAVLSPAGRTAVTRLAVIALGLVRRGRPRPGALA